MTVKKILITGGRGFIGSHSIKYLKKIGFEILAPTSIELDVLYQCNWEDWKKQKIDHVIHLAGKTFVPDSWENPEKFFRVNTIGTLNAINFCRQQDIGMTYISAYIYGQPKSNPISEIADINPNNPYAKSKHMAEQLCEFFCTYFNMDITVLRLFNVYGAKQSERFLIPFIVDQVLNNDTISVQDLAPKRDYVYIDDVCRAIELSIENTKGYQLFNIGSGVSYSVSEVIDKVQAIAGTHKKVISKNSIRRNELNDVKADIKAIKQVWGWEPQFTLDMGLCQYMEELK